LVALARAIATWPRGQWLDRFELQKNELKQLKRLGRAQNCALRSLNNLSAASRQRLVRQARRRGTLAIPSAAVFSSLFAS
jgi:hypothetical protein